MHCFLKAGRGLPLLAWLALSSVGAQTTPVAYTVTIADRASKTIAVTMETPGLSESSVLFCMPAWAPGNYFVNNYGRWIDSVRAYDSSGHPLAVRQTGVNTWKISDARRLRRVTYTAHDIPEDSLDVLPTTLNDLDSDFFYANGPTIFGYVKGLTGPCSMSLKLPEGWRVWCALDSLSPNTFTADDYDQLIDSPILAGTSRIREYRFDVGGVPYVVVVNAESDVPMDSLLTFTKTIVRYETDFFNEVPFRTYYFLFNFFQYHQKYGALEHLGSSAYYLSPPVSERYIRQSVYVRVIAHEFFHIWNPKLIHPDQLGPFDYQKEPRLRSLWFIEGVTEYYARLTLLRSGLSSRSVFYEELKSLALENSRNPDNLESESLRASKIGVPPGMYTKGALVAFLLDIEIRSQTGNTKSLDDVLIEMNKRFGHPNKGYDDRDLIKVIAEISGADLARFYKKYIAGRDELPVDDYFRKAGLLYTYVYRPFLGWNFDYNDDSRLIVTAIGDHSTASALGLQEQDVVTAIQNTAVPSDLDSVRTMLTRLDALAVGDTVRFQVLRHGQSLDLAGQIQPAEVPLVKVIEDSAASPKAAAIRESLFRRP